MSNEFQIRVFRRRALHYTTTIHDFLEIGRQRPGEPEPFHLQRETSRLVIAPIDDKLVSREHLRIELAGANSTDGPITVRNLSKKRSVLIDTMGKLAPQEQTGLSTPFLISFEDFAIRVESPLESGWRSMSLGRPTLAPGTASPSQLSLVAQESILQATRHQNHEPELLIRWLSEVLAVLQSAAASPNFLAESVNALESILRLDITSALRYDQGAWTVECSATAEPDQSRGDSALRPSRSILNEVLEQKCTIYHVPSTAATSASLQGVKALVASPILDSAGEIIGALYGARLSNATTPVPQISELEATMVEVIACSAAAGIEREKQQQKALEARVLFEQFFTPQLARELEKNPRMLEGNEAEISVLFCDVVGFSSISGRIGPRLTMQWISEIMDCLSEIVLEHDGVVVDYIGDELLAMWGAPKKQLDHASKACAAAIALLKCRERIDQDWQARVESPVDFRVGVCSGLASVGNIGTSRRLKYGPLGNTVNLASRLQSAAKQFGVRQLISDSTASQLNKSQVALRPLGTAQLVNIPAPIPIHELGCQEDTQFCELANEFRKLLRLLENGSHEAALEQVETLHQEYPHDLPSKLLLDRLRCQTADLTCDSSCLWALDQK